jgi:hypothetical protein
MAYHIQRESLSRADNFHKTSHFKKKVRQWKRGRGGDFEKYRQFRIAVGVGIEWTWKPRGVQRGKAKRNRKER